MRPTFNPNIGEDVGVEDGDCSQIAERRDAIQLTVAANAIDAKTMEMKSNLAWNGWPRSMSIVSGKAAARL
jgi:hypothetical protein